MTMAGSGTGDVATIDPDGYVRLTDRLKDVIKSGGEWISSIDIENLVVSHPDVFEAAVNRDRASGLARSARCCWSNRVRGALRPNKIFWIFCPLGSRNGGCRTTWSLLKAFRTLRQVNCSKRSCERNITVISR
jgi:fatty-acyl-CoA synthase